MIKTCDLSPHGLRIGQRSAAGAVRTVAEKLVRQFATVEKAWPEQVEAPVAQKLIPILDPHQWSLGTGTCWWISTGS